MQKGRLKKTAMDCKLYFFEQGLNWQESIVANESKCFNVFLGPKKNGHYFLQDWGSILNNGLPRNILKLKKSLIPERKKFGEGSVADISSILFQNLVSVNEKRIV